MKRIIAAILLSLSVMASCTPKQVQAFNELHPTHQESVINHLKDTSVATGGTIEQKIRAKWAGTGQQDRAVRIAKCESGLNPHAKNNHSSASGVFQLIAAHWRGKFNPYNEYANIDYAFKLWQRSGWQPWVCK